MQENTAILRVARFLVTKGQAAVKSNSSEFTNSNSEWAVDPIGLSFGFAKVAENPRLTAPNLVPQGALGFHVVGGDNYSSCVTPFFGEIRDLNGIGGSILLIEAGRRLSLRFMSNVDPREIRVYGANTSVKKSSFFDLYVAFR